MRMIRLLTSGIAAALAFASPVMGITRQADFPRKPTANKHPKPKKMRRSNSKYTPHQGKKECARRVMQMARRNGSITVPQ